VLRLVEQFPPPQRSARLARLAASSSCLRWQWAEMAQWGQAAAALARPGVDDSERQLGQAYLASALYPLDRNAEAEALIAGLHAEPLSPTARAMTLLADCSQHFRRGEHLALPVLYGELLDILERGESLFHWWECAPPVNWSTIAGMPPLMARYVTGVLPRLADRPLPMRAELHMIRAFSELWAGHADAAQAAIDDAEDDMKWLAVSGEMQANLELFGMIFAGIGGRGAELVQRLEGRISRYTGGSPASLVLWRHHMAVYGVRLSDSVGPDPRALQHWAAMLKEDPLRNAAANTPRATAVRARFAAAEGRWADAVTWFEKLLPKLPEMDVMGQRTDLTLRAGHALLQCKRLPEAATVIAPVLDRLLAEGVRGQALLCGPQLLQTLAETRWGGLLTPVQQAELQAAAQLSASLRGAAPATAAAATGGELLSSREREVLERIAAGDSNKLIARALDISPHTVKRHVANILDKLGLASRGQASAWLREHGSPP
ncbi:MAG: LuxR C-terminal-related transcriptional regulator, partial [Rubrivivax sp.]